MVETYQINQLRDAGHEVEIWHLGSLFGVSDNLVLHAPAIEEYAIIISSFQELKDRVRKLEANSIFFSMLGLLHFYPVLYKILKSRNDLIWIGRITKSLPMGSSRQIHPLKALIGNIFFFKLYRPFHNAFLYVAQKVIRKYGAAVGMRSYEPDYLMVSNVKQVPPDFPKNRVIVTHADDYNIHLLNKDISVDPSLQDAVVFLDQMIFYHPDFKNNLREKMNVDDYYENLNKVLDAISEKLGKPVIIAGHPEADKRPGYAEKFNGKKFIVGKSLLLVRHAALVISHYSTAVNFAAIYNKPLVLLTSNGFETIEKIRNPIKVLSKALNAPVINIDEVNLQSIDLKLEPDYLEYKDDYIKSHNTPEELSYPYAVSYVLSLVSGETPEAQQVSLQG
ncbi:hypothetical protein [Pontibacter diazotrophicus]|nr:hypothetical protein [Pontibacter diazotrophicus]